MKGLPPEDMYHNALAAVCVQNRFKALMLSGLIDCCILAFKKGPPTASNRPTAYKLIDTYCAL